MGPDGKWVRRGGRGVPGKGSQGPGCGRASPREPHEELDQGSVLGTDPEGPWVQPWEPPCECGNVDERWHPRSALTPTWPCSRCLEPFCRRPSAAVLPPAAPSPGDADVMSRPWSAVGRAGPAALTCVCTGTLRVDSFLFIFKI